MAVSDRDFLSIVRLAGQKHAEVDKSFVKRHCGKLDEYWKIKKNDTDFHKLKYNMNTNFPLIQVQGWNKFRDFHDLPANVLLEVIYHIDNKTFEISEIIDLDGKNHIPCFHSRSIHPYETVSFDFKLTKRDVNNPTFKISEDFSNYLAKWTMEDLSLCADDGFVYSINVLGRRHDPPTSLGSNWEDLCRVLNFKDGDTIRFKFVVKQQHFSGICHLFKIQ